MRPGLGLTLRRVSEAATNVSTRTPKRHTQQRSQEITAKLASLEKWFLSDQQRPASTSPVAERMRTLLVEHPELSFDKLRELARKEKQK